MERYQIQNLDLLIEYECNYIEDEELLLDEATAKDKIIQHNLESEFK